MKICPFEILMKILGVSGSLRARSTNTALLQAMALLVPAGVTMELFQGIADIPAFNPDLDSVPAAEPVERWRIALQESTAVVFSTPEYAHCIPGALKNALDWVVGSGELSGKLVTLVNASARSIYAQASLREILTTMDASWVAEACVTVSGLNKTDEAATIARDVATADLLSASHRALRARLASSA